MNVPASAVLFAGLMAVSIWQAGEAAYIHTKAWLAQELMQASWRRALSGGGVLKPWPWADTHPVARLIAPRQQADLLILDGASGRTLAFGPGHVPGTPLPGESGNAVISGHRDTHFSFLRELQIGDGLLAQSSGGEIARYEVIGAEVVHKTDVRVVRDAGDDRLTLVTCYPFDSPVAGGPLRYVVVARRVNYAALRI
jgi:sortase A